MNRLLIRILIPALLMAFVLGACAEIPLDDLGIDPNADMGRAEAAQGSGDDFNLAQEERFCATPTPESTPDLVLQESAPGSGSGEASQSSAVPVDPAQDEAGGDIPSPEEREAMLDNVNLAPGMTEADQAVGAGPPPGSESELSKTGDRGPAQAGEATHTPTPCP